MKSKLLYALLLLLALPAISQAQTDASVIYQLSRDFKLNSKVSLLRAKDETQNDYLIFIPSNRYEISLRYDRPNQNAWKNFYFEAKIKYIAHQSRAPRVDTVSEINEAKAQGIDLFANEFLWLAESLVKN